MLMSPGALEEEAVSFVQNNCLAMFTLFWIESSIYASATLVDFHPRVSLLLQNLPLNLTILRQKICGSNVLYIAVADPV
jgi:hypothetical protein